MNTAQQKEIKPEMIAFILKKPDMKFVAWQEIMARVVATEVTIKRYRGHRQLKYRDLGVHFDSKEKERKASDIFRLGMKNLLPAEKLRALDNIEARARQTLRRWSIKTVWGMCVPVPDFQEFLKIMEDIKEEYFAEQKDILDNYDSIKRRMISEYAAMALDSYDRMKAASPEALTKEEIERKRLFLRNTLRTVRALFPSREKIEGSFEFYLSYTYIDLPRLAGDGEDDPMAAPGSVVSSTIDNISEEEMEKFRWYRASQEQKQAMMRKMNEEVVREARKQKKKLIDDFLTQSIGQVRSMVYEISVNVLDSIQNKGGIHKASAKSLNTLITKVRRLNFFDDRELDSAMEMLEDMIEGEGSWKNVDVSEVKRVLADLSVVMRASLVDIGYYDIQERDSGAGEDDFYVPTRQEEIAARESMGFDIPEWVRSEVTEDEGESTFVVAGDERTEAIW